MAAQRPGVKTLRPVAAEPSTTARPPVLDEVRTAIGEILPQVCGLVTAIARPDAPCLGVWNAVETAVHLMQTMEADVAALTRSFSAEQRAAFEGSELRSLDEMTQRMVRDEAERDPVVLGRRMAAAGEALTAVLDGAEDDRAVTWLGGMVLPLSAIGAHVVEESLVHGRDIARSQERGWPIDRAHATTAVGRFVLPMMEAMNPADSVDTAAAAGLNAAFDFRIRRTGRLAFVFVDGSLHVERDFAGRADVHISADPAAFLLVFLNRAHPLRAALTGQLAVWGRRPWLMPRLSQVVKGP
jgi:hypothetical protein